MAGRFQSLSITEEGDVYMEFGPPVLRNNVDFGDDKLALVRLRAVVQFWKWYD